MSPLKRNTGKIQITPSNGYKIDEIIVNYPNKSRKVKNGSSISLKMYEKYQCGIIQQRNLHIIKIQEKTIGDGRALR